MSTPKQYKYTRLQTPVGEAIYPHLNKPDTKYNVDGIYKVKLKIPLSDELTAFISAIEAENETHYQAAAAEAKAESKKPPKRAEVNFYEDESFGYLTVKCNATIKMKDTGDVIQKNLPILDGNGNKFEGLRYVNSGAELQAVVDLVPMKSSVAGAGVSLRLICVKVHKFTSLPPRETPAPAPAQTAVSDQPF